MSIALRLPLLLCCCHAAVARPTMGNVLSAVARLSMQRTTTARRCSGMRLSVQRTATARRELSMQNTATARRPTVVLCCRRGGQRQRGERSRFRQIWHHIDYHKRGPAIIEKLESSPTLQSEIARMSAQRTATARRVTSTIDSHGDGHEPHYPIPHF